MSHSFPLISLGNTSLALRSIVRLSSEENFLLARADWATIVVGIASYFGCHCADFPNFRKSRPTAPAEDCAHLPRPWIETCWPPLIWAFSYIVFLLFGRPQDTFHWLFCLPALVLLIAGAIGARSSGSAYKWFAILTTLLFAANFMFYIIPTRARKITPSFPSPSRVSRSGLLGRPLIYSKFHSDLWTISYFNPQAGGLSCPILPWPI